MDARGSLLRWLTLNPAATLLKVATTQEPACDPCFNKSDLEMREDQKRMRPNLRQ